MDKETKPSADWYRLMGWAHANRKLLTGASVGIILVAAIAGTWAWNKNHRQLMASEALSNLKPLPDENVTAAQAAPYQKLADDYSGTAAAARARLFAAEALFRSRSFKEAGDEFRKFLQDYPDYPAANEAVLGMAACLDAQGDKTKEAITAYEDLIKHHAGDTTTSQAKSALARLYVATDKPDQALHLYEDLMRGNSANDSWAIEATMQRQELLDKHPELRPPPPVAPPAPATSPAGNPPPTAAPVGGPGDITAPPAIILPQRGVTTAPGTNPVIKQQP